MKRILSIACCLSALLACQDMQSQKEKIQTTKSGYQYSLAQDEPGPTVQPGQFALIHTVVTQNDSVLTDTRVNPGRPTLVKVEDKVGKARGISGPVQDLLQLMSVGDSARFYYPIDSFPSVPDRYKAFKEVVYDIRVLDIFESETEMQAYMDAERERINAPIREAQGREQEVSNKVAEFYASYKRGEKESQWLEGPEGLKYIILEKSRANRKPQNGEVVRPHYYGFFAEDGKPFDNSFSRGQTYDFTLGQGEVIRGWDVGFTLLDKGDKAVFLVPPSLAYGEQGYPGAIPPNATLLFYVELVGIGETD